MVLLAVATFSLSSAAGWTARESRLGTGASTRLQADVQDAFHALPLAFVRNQRQLDRRVRFSAQAGNVSFFLTQGAAVLALGGGDREGLALRLRFLGSSPDAAITGARPSPARVSYFIGNDPSRWSPNVPAYEEVVYRRLWPGIDMAVRGASGAFKYEFRVRARANPRRIRLAYQGQEHLRLERDGALRIDTALGVLRDARPRSYQTIAGRRIPVASRFALGQDGVYGFALGRYDRRHPLVIDPGLVYSTFLGGTGEDTDDIGYRIAVDGTGNAYVAGDTESRNFPTKAGAFDRRFGGDYEAFVTKLNAAGSRLVYSTFLGGAGFDGVGGIAVDSSGNAYVAGGTDSRAFPTTTGAFDRSYNGGQADAFVLKLNTTGSRLVYSTFLGGAGGDGGGAIAIDLEGNAYVAGGTASRAFPKAGDAFDRNYNGGPYDVFVTKVNGAGSHLVYSTYVGGNGSESAQGIAIDATGAYITGGTRSTNFPISDGAFDVSQNGGRGDAFVTKLNATGSRLAYSTYLGGSGGPGAGRDGGSGIAVDGTGSAYVAGRTASRNFPTTPGAVDRSYMGSSGEAFVTKLNPAGTDLAYSTFLGGRNDDGATGIAVDGAGRAHVTGETNSGNFPTVAGAFRRRSAGESDAFVTRLNSAGSALEYSTYLGGRYFDEGLAIALGPGGRVYVTGQTSSENFPTTARAFDRKLGFYDAFVTKLLLDRH